MIVPVLGILGYLWLISIGFQVVFGLAWWEALGVAVFVSAAIFGLVALDEKPTP